LETLQRGKGEKANIPVGTLNQATVTLMTALDELPMGNQQSWYHKLGDVAESYANLCELSGRPIKGINLLSKMIAKVHGSADEYTNVHTWFAD